MRLLIIEDEKKIVLPLKKALERYSYAVDYAVDGLEGYKMASQENYDCIILDLNIPSLDGLEVAKKLRSQKIFTPILMLTARVEQEDLIDGFESGADDYLRKPFHFQELLLRINSLVKRNSINKSELLQVANIKVDTKLKKVYKNNIGIDLDSKEYGVLEYLLRNRGKAISQEELLEHVWDREVNIFTQSVRTHIKTLRQKIDPEKKIINTIKGSGYKID